MTPEERAKYLDHEWTGSGWRTIIETTDRLLAYIDPGYTIEQVKEKFGGLRYYFSPSDGFGKRFYTADHMSGVVMMAEALSLVTCEQCGQPGTSKGGNQQWTKTFCDKCREVNRD